MLESNHRDVTLIEEIVMDNEISFESLEGSGHKMTKIHLRNHCHYDSLLFKVTPTFEINSS